MISSATLRRAAKIAPVAAVQPEYSLFGRDIEGPAGTGLLATCRELGVAVVCATPLGRGLLASDFGSQAATRPVRPESKGDAAVPGGKPGAQRGRRGQDPPVGGGQEGVLGVPLALAWLLKQGDDIFVVPGTRRVQYLEENWAANWVELTDDEEKDLRRLAESCELAGEALPEQFLDHKFRNTKELSS